MQLKFYPGTNRIVCRWTEQVPFVMGEKRGTIEKVRSINLRVNKGGSLRSKDVQRHGSHPLFQAVQDFCQELRRCGVLQGEPEEQPCVHCGALSDVVPFYDAGRGRMVWACAEPDTCGHGRQ
jgi:hypothetical protein